MLLSCFGFYNSMGAALYLTFGLTYIHSGRICYARKYTQPLRVCFRNHYIYTTPYTKRTEESLYVMALCMLTRWCNGSREDLQDGNTSVVVQYLTHDSYSCNHHIRGCQCFLQTVCRCRCNHELPFFDILYKALYVEEYRDHDPICCPKPFCS